MGEQASDVRRAALAILGDARKGELADRALARHGAGLDARDHAWLQELVYGTFRLRGRIDHILAAFVREKLTALDPEVLDILRLGAYQLLEMGSVPAYAAVSQSVELTRAAGVGRASGFVNGVLQAVRRGSAEVTYPAFEDDPVGHLTTRGSHPAWLVRRWVERWGAEEARTLVELDNTRPEVFLRPVGLSAPEAMRVLAERGVAVEPVALFPDSLRLAPETTPSSALAAVPAVVQDPAASAVVRYCDFPAGATVLDLAAAPGGKTVGLAEGAAYVVANDLSAGRLRRVRANAERTGVAEKVGPVVSDGRRPPFRPVDAVLLDAPCTGTGTLRRHPDGRWRITGRDLRALVRLQRELLASAAALVRPGGLLVYATCSLEPEENDEQVAWLLEGHPEFRIEPPSAPFDPSMTSDGVLRVLPHRHGVDGAFAARLKRNE